MRTLGLYAHSHGALSHAHGRITYSILSVLSRHVSTRRRSTNNRQRTLSGCSHAHKEEITISDAHCIDSSKFSHFKQTTKSEKNLWLRFFVGIPNIRSPPRHDMKGQDKTVILERCICCVSCCVGLHAAVPLYPWFLFYFHSHLFGEKRSLRGVPAAVLQTEGQMRKDLSIIICFITSSYFVGNVSITEWYANIHLRYAAE